MRKSSPICEIIVITQCLWHQIFKVNIPRFSKAGYDHARARFDTFWKIYFNRLNTFHLLHFTNWNLDFKQLFLHSHKINLFNKKNPLLFCHGRFKYKAAAFLKNISSKDSRCTGVKGFLILTSSITLVQLKKGIFHCNHFHYIYLIFSFSNKSYWLWKIQQYCKT